MAKQAQGGGRPRTLQVSTAQRPDFKGPLAAYLFDGNGELVHRAEVRGGKVDVPLSPADIGRVRLLIAPADPGQDLKGLKPDRLKRMGAYEPAIRIAGRIVDRIDIPGSIIDIWPFCFCWVHGKVVRDVDNRVVCNARVHICEVDPVRIWILQLRDRDIFRLRDDLLEVFRHPPVPPGPDPDPGPYRRGIRSALRFSGYEVSLNPQPLPPKEAGGAVSLNPQPLPPRETGGAVSLNPQPLPPIASMRMRDLPSLEALGLEQISALRSTSPLIVRNALIANWKLLLPWFCHWRYWWPWLRCDEIAVVDTDAFGRFETTILYNCAGDHPDLYFWVEYDFGSGFETVYRPGLPCNIYWNYACGSEITIRITDPRVPACGGPADLPGKQVVVLSLGRTVAVREVGSGGLTNFGEPFGEKLEPRVDFSATNLAAIGVQYYQWSYQRLTGPDGSSTTVDPSSQPIGVWNVMSREVTRHYKVGTTYVPEKMGPFPTPLPDAFKIQQVAPPPGGEEWIVLDEREDLATAHFETTKLPGTPTSNATEDLAAGLYEIKLELFDTGGNLVDLTAQGIDLRITDQDAPFGSGTITTTSAPAINRVLNGAGHTFGFRMVVRVDNNFCFAEINPVGGTVTPDPDCGFHNYTSPSDTAGLSFVARHPNNFATFSFGSGRGTGPAISDTVTGGVAGLAASNGYGHSGFAYSKGITVGVLTAPMSPSTVSCPNAAFWERLDVSAMATNGYGTLSGYNAADNAAYALATPCPDCNHGHHDH